jgi:DNA-binding NtrC family response regulator
MTCKAKILVLDDEKVVRRSCRKILEHEGYEVALAETAEAALELLRNSDYDIILSDIKLPGMDGMEFLRAAKEECAETEVIMITGYGSIQGAVEAMKLGAFDYICKPFLPDEIRVVVKKALDRNRLLRENRRLREQLRREREFKEIVGKSEPMEDLFSRIFKIAATNCTVLLRGESGTGKELVARAIHKASPRSKKPFIAVDCGGLSSSLLESELFGHVKGSFTGAVVTKPGLLEVAEGGTFFMDEISNLSMDIQVKLLRVLQERTFRRVGGARDMAADVRLIAATNQDLEAMVREGTFREDLFYRVNVVPITVPPLRERQDDIPLLAHYFLEKFSRELKKDVRTVSREAMDLLTAYPWPGNVRELENLVERLVIMTETDAIEAKDLPEAIRQPHQARATAVPRDKDELKEVKKEIRKKAVEEVEKAFILEALERNDGDVSRAAQETGMQRTNFWALMTKYGITPPNRKNGE